MRFGPLLFAAKLEHAALAAHKAERAIRCAEPAARAAAARQFLPTGRQIQARSESRHPHKTLKNLHKRNGTGLARRLRGITVRVAIRGLLG